jgi:putative Mg2+ transporter-C (MgtC) family protein
VWWQQSWITIQQEFSDLGDVDSITRLVVRMLVAIVLGGILGYERESVGASAGLRTHMLVSLGSALFVLIPLQAGMQIEDLSRVLQGVTAGIGFLGAGAILKEGASIRGLTTAASLWATAAIGLAAGLGSFFAAVAACVFLLLSLVFLRTPRGWVRRKLARSLETVIIHVRHGANPSEVVSALHEIDGCDVRSLSIRREDEGLTIEADLKADPKCDLETELGEIAGRKDVTGLDMA